jgi:hypothetical protein
MYHLMHRDARKNKAKRSAAQGTRRGLKKKKKGKYTCLRDDGGAWFLFFLRVARAHSAG